MRATATWLKPPEELAVLSAGGGSSLTRPDHLCNNWMVLFVLHDPGDESIGSFHSRFSLCEWPIKYDGNQLFSIFFDQGWSAGLHLLQDCYCAIQFVVEPFEALGFLARR